MKKSGSTYLTRLGKAAVIAVLLLCCAGAAHAKYPVVKSVLIKKAPLSLEFEVTGRAPVKVIRIGEKEVLIAVKNAVLAKGYKVKGKTPLIRSVNVETLDGNVVAFVVTSNRPYGKIGAGFNKANTRLTLVLDKDRTMVPAKAEAKKAVPEAPGKPRVPEVLAEKAPAPRVAPEPVAPAPRKKALPAPEPAPKVVASLPSGSGTGKKRPGPKVKTAGPKAPPAYIPPKRHQSPFRGDIGDLYRGEDPLMGCKAKPVEKALLLVRKELYKEAHEILANYLFQENFACLEQVRYLTAYVFYKSLEKDDIPGLLKAATMFQEALVAYPGSRYIPYAYAGLGMIQARLNNAAAAQGYFNMVQQRYPEYTGMPEVLYYLAVIYDEKGYTDKALRLYKKVFQAPVDNSYVMDAGIGYGKSLFDKRQYFDALSVLDYVVKNDIKKVYEGPDLLMYTGNASFELGLSARARKDFIRALNLFPDVPDRDIVLSKVGDAFGMENNEDKAIKIYDLVREKFPDSQGFINASIGIARYLKRDPEKIEIYEMIKTKYPENTYARIAMMRLAEIYQKNGEYDKCIQEIEDLLSTHPRGLRYEAVKLMQEAYEALFKEQLKSDEYTSVLNRYELEHTKLDKMNSRLIAFRVGLSYLKADLYEEAFNQLIQAYKMYKRAKRPPQLLFGLGLAMDESGRDDDALKLFDAFAKRFPKSKNRVAALMRMGQIHLEKKRLAKADQMFKIALKAAKNPLDRGDILMRHAKVQLKKRDIKAASRLRERAVKAFAAAPGQNYQILADAYKTLGNTYLDLKSYVRAADAFSKALGFSEGDRAKANIGFLLGDAYQKGNIMDKAKETFEQVVQSYDSVWARLAEQRLTTMELAGKMINS